VAPVMKWIRRHWHHNVRQLLCHRPELGVAVGGAGRDVTNLQQGIEDPYLEKSNGTVASWWWWGREQGKVADFWMAVNRGSRGSVLWARARYMYVYVGRVSSPRTKIVGWGGYDPEK